MKEVIIKPTFTKEDVCILSVPSFGGRVPALALDRMRSWQGNQAKAILLGVYGNRAQEDTLLELRDFLIKHDFTCIAAIAAVAEHSIFPQFGAQRPDDRDQVELQTFAKQILPLLSSASPHASLELPGNFPYREYHGVPLKPTADASCIACGQCAKECPTQAIPLDHLVSVNKDLCISCMHCISICPVQARHNNKIMLFAAAQKMKKNCTSRKNNTLYLAS